MVQQMTTTAAHVAADQNQTISLSVWYTKIYIKLPIAALLSMERLKRSL